MALREMKGQEDSLGLQAPLDCRYSIQIVFYSLLPIKFYIQDALVIIYTSLMFIRVYQAHLEKRERPEMLGHW